MIDLIKQNSPSLTNYVNIKKTRMSMKTRHLFIQNDTSECGDRFEYFYEFYCSSTCIN